MNMEEMVMRSLCLGIFYWMWICFVGTYKDAIGGFRGNATLSYIWVWWHRWFWSFCVEITERMIITSLSVFIGMMCLVASVIGSALCLPYPEGKSDSRYDYYIERCIENYYVKKFTWMVHGRMARHLVDLRDVLYGM